MALGEKIENGSSNLGPTCDQRGRDHNWTRTDDGGRRCVECKVYEVPDGGPAFPVLRNDPWGKPVHTPTGISVRDYFAAHAPQMTDQWFKDSGGHWLNAQASWSYAYADAMLRARKAQS